MGFSIIEEESTATFDVKIKVIGVGGGGGNMINHIVREGINQLGGMENVALLSANTDAQALQKSLATSTIQLGEHKTRGLGAGQKPEVGKEAADESFDEVKSMLEGSNIVFIAAGFGGGTGTGAAPVIARAAKDSGALTVAIVTTPFKFEQRKRMNLALAGIEELRKECDSIIIIPNEKLLSISDNKMGFKDAFKIVDNVLADAVSGMCSVILQSGESDINLDFNDVKTAMSHRGRSLFGMGRAQGDHPAQEAVKLAIQSPLLDDVDIRGAKGVLINFHFHPDHEFGDINEAMGLVGEMINDDGEIDMFFGTLTDSKMPEDVVEVTVIATGIDDQEEEKIDPKPVSAPAQKTGTDNYLFADFFDSGVGGAAKLDPSADLDSPAFNRRRMD